MRSASHISGETEPNLATHTALISEHTISTHTTHRGVKDHAHGSPTSTCMVTPKRTCSWPTRAWSSARDAIALCIAILMLIMGNELEKDVSKQFALSEQRQFQGRGRDLSAQD